MNKGELISILEPYTDDIEIVVISGGAQMPIKASIYECSEHLDEFVLSLVMSNVLRDIRGTKP
jgi:hypothetical protein